MADIDALRAEAEMIKPQSTTFLRQTVADIEGRTFHVGGADRSAHIDAADDV